MKIGGILTALLGSEQIFDGIPRGISCYGIIYRRLLVI
jgi:hypothetical protein